MTLGLILLMSSGSKKEEPSYTCLSEVKTSHSQRMWAEVSSSAPHLLHNGLSTNEHTAGCRFSYSRMLQFVASMYWLLAAVTSSVRQCAVTAIVSMPCVSEVFVMRTWSRRRPQLEQIVDTFALLGTLLIHVQCTCSIGTRGWQMFVAEVTCVACAEGVRTQSTGVWESSTGDRRCWKGCFRELRGSDT